jgi:hypothetical protein
MTKIEVVGLLRCGKKLILTGDLSYQSRFETGEVVAHQIMQSLIEAAVVKKPVSIKRGHVWMLTD